MTTAIEERLVTSAIRVGQVYASTQKRDVQVGARQRRRVTAVDEKSIWLRTEGDDAAPDAPSTRVQLQSAGASTIPGYRLVEDVEVDAVPGTDTDPLGYQVSTRGFKHYAAIPADGNQTVRIYESAAKGEPCLWMAVGGTKAYAYAHLTLDEARAVRDTLDAAISGHYQCVGGPTDEEGA